jgi:hypothetical protein
MSQESSFDRFGQILPASARCSIPLAFRRWVLNSKQKDVEPSRGIGKKVLLKTNQ